jgi:hypothetical protein
VSRQSSDGDGLLVAFGAALANLQEHAEAINALNVFPVPDGDTGSNMLATLRAAVAEAQRLPDEQRTAGAVTAAISHGALMGARGNSGVILSQILRGIAEASSGRRRINALDLAHALSVGSQTAHAAVVRPVEGTILTVVRESAQAAVAAAEHEPDIEAVLAAAVEAAAASVARTPALLPVLRDAGVVDAGGEGLHRILQGALRGLLGVWHAGPDRMEPSRAAIVAGEDGAFGYETMFLATAGTQPLDVGAIRSRLEGIGESILVAGDARAVKVHIHNLRPDLVLAYGLTLGALSHISVENLDHQAREAREARASAFTGVRAATAQGALPAAAANREDRPPASTAALTPPGSPGPGPDEIHAGPGVVAVASGQGLIAVFRSFGVAEVIEGGQAANPSTGELLVAAQRIDRAEVLVLPNNANVRLAAEQAASLSGHPRMVVVPTRNAAEGFAALLAYEPGRDAEANAAEMLDAARAIQTLQVTDAVRDARIDGRRVRRGQTIVLNPDDGLVAADGDRTAAVVAAMRSLQPGYELVTLYYGADADLAEAEELANAIRSAGPGVEVEVVHGGQPHYRYLVAAE